MWAVNRTDKNPCPDSGELPPTLQIHILKPQLPVWLNLEMGPLGSKKVKKVSAIGLVILHSLSFHPLHVQTPRKGHGRTEGEAAVFLDKEERIH